MSLKKPLFYLVIIASMFILGVQAAFAGGVDPELGTPQVDARICGRDGSSTQGVTIRWTDRFTTADPDSTTGTAYPPNTAVNMIGRDFWGCWVSVTSAEGNAWVPVDALNVNTIMGLPILVNNSDGCSISDGSAVTCGGAGAVAPAGGGNGSCVIPASGPWPACATGGGAAAPAGNGGCVIPASGPWPACARKVSLN